MLPTTASPLALFHVVLLACLVAVTTSSQAEPLLYCDGAGYYPSEYTCFNNTILCPILFGEPSLPCKGACYSPSMYSCTAVGDGNGDKKLQLLLPQEAPFAVVVHSSSPDLHGRMVQACGRRFAIGKDARTCEWCYGDCSGYGNKTVLFGNGRLVSFVYLIFYFSCALTRGPGKENKKMWNLNHDCQRPHTDRHPFPAPPNISATLLYMSTGSGRYMLALLTS